MTTQRPAGPVAPGISDVPVVDVHAHALPASVVQSLGQGDWYGLRVVLEEEQLVLHQPSGQRHPVPGSTGAADVDRRLADMDSTGVDVQVLSLLPSLWHYGVEGIDTVGAARQSNDDLIGVARDRPDRFRIFAHLPLDRPDAAVEELERCMDDDVVVGAAVCTHVAGANWDAPELFEILEAAQRLGALLFFHPAAVRFTQHMSRHHLRNLIGNPTETTLALASLVFGGVLDRLPDLQTVFAHGGGYAGFAAGRFDHGASVREENRELAEEPSAYLRRMYFDSLLHSEEALRYLLDTVGSDRVVLGTDYPADMGPADPVGLLQTMGGLDEEERRAVLGGNLVRLLGLEQGSAARSR